MLFKIKVKIFLFSAMLAFITSNAQEDTASIRTNFQNFKTAIFEEDSQGVLDLIDSNSFLYYSRIFKLAKSADSVQVEKLPIYEKGLVFAIRIRGQNHDLLKMSDSSFFMYAVENRLVDQAGMPLSGGDLGEISISAIKATANFLVVNIKLPYQVIFSKQQNKWKVDITSLIPVSNMVLKSMAVRDNKTDTEFLLSIAKMSSEESDLKSIWQPLKR